MKYIQYSTKFSEKKVFAEPTSTAPYTAPISDSRPPTAA